jgi:hypothetical protein
VRRETQIDADYSSKAGFWLAKQSQWRHFLRICFQLAKTWLHRCLDGHATCRREGNGNEMKMPIANPPAGRLCSKGRRITSWNPRNDRFSSVCVSESLLRWCVEAIQNHSSHARRTQARQSLEGATVVRQAVLYQNRFVLTVLMFWSHDKGWGLLHVTCGNHIRKLAFL